MAIVNRSYCDRLWYELRLIYLRLYYCYDDWVNPPCHACGVKKEK